MGRLALLGVSLTFHNDHNGSFKSENKQNKKADSFTIRLLPQGSAQEGVGNIIKVSQGMAHSINCFKKTGGVKPALALDESTLGFTSARCLHAYIKKYSIASSQ